MREELSFSYGEGRYKIFVTAVITADGVSATITGGDKPHVGGMAMSIPRPGGTSGKTACDTWIIPVPGHKDHEVASQASRLICLQTGMTAAVTAGIHIDQARPEEIALVVQNCHKAAELLCHKVSRGQCQGDGSLDTL